MKYSTVLTEAEDDRTIVPENLEIFFRFLYERQSIWYNRFVLKLPRDEWTDDPYLTKSKYTNVYRELDRGTIWWFKYIASILRVRKDFKKEDRKKEVIWKTCVYRLLNKVETFDRIGVPTLNMFRQEDVRHRWFGLIKSLLDADVKVWTSATITLQSNLKATRLENYQRILGRLLDNIDELANDIIATNSIEQVYKYLLKQYGIGPFTAYEIATDLAYLKPFKLDINEWANAGPGCKPGIKLIFPWASTNEEYLYCMKTLRDMQNRFFRKYKLDFMSIAYREEFLNLRNIEHSLCEFRKYYSESKGIGRPRIKFAPVSSGELYDKDHI